MSDLTERLRAVCIGGCHVLHREAADRIEDLQDEVEGWKRHVEKIFEHFGLGRVQYP